MCTIAIKYATFREKRHAKYRLFGANPQNIHFCSKFIHNLVV